MALALGYPEPACTQLFAYDIRGDQKRLVHDFAADFPGQQFVAVWMHYEGSPSFDGCYWGLMAEDENCSSSFA